MEGTGSHLSDTVRLLQLFEYDTMFADENPSQFRDEPLLSPDQQDCAQVKDAYGFHDESKCLYVNDTVVVTLLATVAVRCRSRNAADACRNSEAMAASIVTSP